MCFKRKKETRKFKFSGGEYLVWKHPETLINDRVEIIVPHTHEVIYIQEGALLSSLSPGIHKPISEIKKMSREDRRKAKKGIDSTVLYVNTQSTLHVVWGTPSRMDVFDPKINIPVSVGLSGFFAIRITDPKIFVTRLGGIDAIYTKEHLEDYFKTIMIQYIKESLANAMIIQQVSFYEIWNNTRSITKIIKEDLHDKYLNYGVELVEFAIDNIVITEDVKKLVEQTYKEKFVVETKGFTHKELYEDIKDDIKDSRKTIKDIVVESSNKKTKKDISFKFCNKCGEQNKKNSNFCKSCGEKI